MLALRLRIVPMAPAQPKSSPKLSPPSARIGLLAALNPLNGLLIRLVTAWVAKVTLV
jgi:hypothetical protein